MDISFDATWCLVCSRQILPKRILVPIPPEPQQPAPQPEEQQPPAPAPAPAPAPPPTTPTAPARAKRTRGVVSRPRGGGGLLHGTGRVKRDGTLRSSPTHSTTSQKAKQPTAAPAPAPAPAPPVVQPAPQAPAAPVRHRTIIDQSPAPVYCSDECRLQDMQSNAGIDINFNPDRDRRETASPTLPPVPNNSFVASDSSASSSSSLESQPHQENYFGPQKKEQPSYPIPRGYAALASVYDLPPCPPPPPLLRTETSSSSKSSKSSASVLSGPSTTSPSSDESDEYRFNRPEDYTSGVMMAARRIQEALAPKPQPKKRPSWATPSSMLSTAYALNITATAQGKSKVVPGWTDGSDRWRASVYSFSAPPKADDNDLVAQAEEDERIKAIYSCKGVKSTPLRSRGVYSTLGESSSDAASTSSAASRGRPPLSSDGQRAKSEAAELYAKWDMSFTRRSESRSGRKPTPSQPPCRHHAHHRAALASPTHSTRSLPTLASTPRRREVPLLKKGAEGKLLVPDVKLRRTDSSASFRDSPSVASIRGDENCIECAECVVCADETSSRRGLSRRGSEASVCTEASTSSRSTSRSTRGQVPMWSYSDKTPLYPILDLPTTEKRLERRKVKEIVRVVGPDGQEHEEEREVDKIVEVEVLVKERKRLFLFPGAGK